MSTARERITDWRGARMLRPGEKPRKPISIKELRKRAKAKATSPK